MSNNWRFCVKTEPNPPVETAWDATLARCRKRRYGKEARSALRGEQNEREMAFLGPCRLHRRPLDDASSGAVVARSGGRCRWPPSLAEGCWHSSLSSGRAKLHVRLHRRRTLV